MRFLLLLLSFIMLGITFGCGNQNEKHGTLSVAPQLTTQGLNSQDSDFMITENNGKVTRLIRDKQTRYKNIKIDNNGNVSFVFGKPRIVVGKDGSISVKFSNSDEYQIKGNDTTTANGVAFHVYEMEYIDKR